MTRKCKAYRIKCKFISHVREQIFHMLIFDVESGRNILVKRKIILLYKSIYILED